MFPIPWKKEQDFFFFHHETLMQYAHIKKFEKLKKKIKVWETDWKMIIKYKMPIVTHSEDDAS